MTRPDPIARRWFQRRLLAWYARFGRDLPWRRTADPYHILVSEVMLQQTQVDRVIPKYHQFLGHYPTLDELARAPVDEVRRLWYPLGYNARPVNLVGIARETVARYAGRLPDDPRALRAMRGIGRYTAGAILSFAYRRPAPVVDTNVRRVVARLGGKSDAGTATTKADLAAAESLLPEDAPTAARVSIALMELGALMCKARAPECGVCPVSAVCGFSGQEVPAGPSRKRQTYKGTNRHVRGEVMALLRDADEPVERARIDAVWPDRRMLDEAVAQLIAEGLIGTDESGRFELPSR